MLTQLGDINRTVNMLDELRRRMDRLWEDYDGEDTDGQARFAAASGWPRVNLYDSGSSLLVQADVPGLSEKDLQISINQDVLSISGERKPEVLEGYSVHRQERAAFNFARSFSLPCPVDADKTTASIQNGVLTVTLAKAPEAQPRKITVQAQQ